MPGFFGAFGAGCDSLRASQLVDTLDPTGKAGREIWRGVQGWVADAVCNRAAFVHAQGDWRGWFCGELPGIRQIPWKNLILALREHDHGVLTSLNGWFAILLVHEPSGRIWAVSDRRAQQPMFSFVTGETAYISTAVSAFCRFPSPPAFDQGWLYETIYFGHPVLDRSFLKGVSRVPPATVMTWQPGDHAFTARLWAPPFSRPAELVRGKQAADLEQQIFLEVAADYFDDDPNTAVALTSGFDSRAALASAPRRGDLLAYTYGVAECRDIIEAAKAAADIGVFHLAIELNDQFNVQLKEHMINAVRYSDGLERVVRAELMEVYPTLAANGRTIVVGGVSGDHLFRDHLRGSGNVPHLISAAMMDYIQGRDNGLENHEFSELFGEFYHDFQDHICACLERLLMRHGDLRQPEGYLRYLVYENAPKHFGGEAALAGNYVHFRTIYWDPRLVELSFVSERGTLGLSERLPGKDRFVEAAMQAGVIEAGPNYGGGRIKGVRASTWTRGNRILYRIEDTLNKVGRYVTNGFRRPKFPGLLSWSAWLSGPARTLCEDLFAPDARLRAYLEEEFLNTLVPEADVRLAGRLLTAELVLRFIEEQWPIYPYKEDADNNEIVDNTRPRAIKH